MIIAILSDAHGNKLFFERVWRSIQRNQPNKIVYLGDIYGYMPYGKEILKTLRNNCDVLLKGNHEAMLLGEQHLDIEKDKIYRLSEEKRRLAEEEKNFLYDLECYQEICIDKKRILFVHGSLQDRINGYLYEDDTSYVWDEPEYDYVFMGHTHRPYIKRGKRTVFVNVGSCGLPRDIGLQPSYALFDTVNGDVTIVRILIDEKLIAAQDYQGISSEVLAVFERGHK